MLRQEAFFSIRRLLKFLAVAGNILFIPWLLHNRADEGFRASAYQLVSYIGLTILLLLNSHLVLSGDKKP